jgi:hypothetical protein
LAGHDLAGVIGEDHPYRHSFGGPLDLVVQKEAADQLVVVVRPDKRYGVSLWGESGDAVMVEVIFCVQPESGRVSASNQCT